MVGAPFSVSPILGVPPLRNVALGQGQFLTFGETGDTYPAVSGYINTASRTATWWNGRNGAGDAIVVAQNASTLQFGDDNAVSPWNVNYKGYQTSISGKLTLTLITGTGVGALAINEFSSGNTNFRATLVAGGGTSIFEFGENVLPIFRQLQAVTNTNGADFTCAAQTGKAGSVGNGGNWIVDGGAQGGGGGTDGVVKIATNRGFAQFGPALVAVGGGTGTAAFGANGVGGANQPTVVAQNSWLRVKDSTGAVSWIPIWK